MVRILMKHFLGETRQIFAAIMEYFWQENLTLPQPENAIKKFSDKFKQFQNVCHKIDFSNESINSRR